VAADFPAEGELTKVSIMSVLDQTGSQRRRKLQDEIFLSS
jgi:hypothetical protein